MRIDIQRRGAQSKARTHLKHLADQLDLLSWQPAPRVDLATRRLAQRLGLSLNTARAITQLASLGEEARQ